MSFRLERRLAPSRWMTWASPLIALLLTTLLIKAWRMRQDAGARIALSLLVFAMVAMISDVYAVFHRPSPYWVILWLPVGLIMGLKRLKSETGHRFG